MSLPQSPDRVLNNGDTVDHQIVNSIQYGVVANNDRMHKRILSISVENNTRIIVNNNLAFIDGRVEANQLGDKVSVALNGLWVEPASQIVQIRARVFQTAGVGGDRWDMAVVEFDASDTKTTLLTVKADAVAGWKWLDSGPLARDIKSGYRWQVTFEHDATSGPAVDNLKLSMVEVYLGG